MDGNIELGDLPIDMAIPFNTAYVLSHFPNEERIAKLNTEFRFWHTESLLNQAANLIDQCLKDLATFKQLELLEFNVNQEISLFQKEIELEKSKITPFDRDWIVAQLENNLLNDRFDKDGKATGEASAIYEWVSGLGEEFIKPEFKYLERLRAAIGLIDKEIVEIIQKREKEIIEYKCRWFESDSIANTKLFEFKEGQLEEKVKQLEENLALDFSFQKSLYFKRLERNYDDALKRAVVAEDGLKKIYGRPKALALRIKSPDQIQYNTTELYNWIYESIEYLTAYSQLDQSFTVCLSLQALLSDDEFQNLTNQTEQFTTNFLVDKSYFPTGSHQNIRFKGIGASLIGRVGTIPWKIEVSLPKNAVYIRNDNSFEIYQHDVPSCILGRVENRNSVRGIEYGGIVSLNNLSPIAADGDELANHWSIKIEKPKADSEKFHNIEDIVIEFLGAGKV